MSDNPLAGLPIVSLDEIVAGAVGRLGIGTLDLAHPLHRQRLIDSLVHSLSLSMQWTLERTIEAAVGRAVGHVFKVMRDPDYQEKRQKRLAASRKKSLERRQARAEADRKARMDYSKQRLEVTKATVN